MEFPFGYFLSLTLYMNSLCDQEPFVGDGMNEHACNCYGLIIVSVVSWLSTAPVHSKSADLN